MFAIEQAVENWKNDLRQKQTLLETDIEELELHLREEMERLTPLGLNEEESFLIATRRIGDTAQMASEFAKVNTAAIWKNRFFWMIIGALLLQIFTSWAGLLAGGGALLGHQLTGLSWLATGVLNSILQNIVVLAFFYVFYAAVVRTSLFRHIRKRLAIGSIIVMLALTFLLNMLISVGRSTLMARLCSPEQWGQFSVGLGYSSFGLAMFWPVIWLVLLYWLRPEKTQTT